jgi:beta-phosphoglucomutase
VPLRAIVFDFDGVIANSEPLHYQAFRDVLAVEGVTLGEADYYARYLGYDDAGAFAAVGSDHNRPWTSSDIAGFVARKADQMTELERNATVLFPGAADTVRRVAAAMPIAIASGALGHEIRRVLDRENLTEYFSAIVAAEDTGRSKPAPDPYLRAVELLRESIPGLQPAHCVAVEDSAWGLESARVAGLRTLGVAQSYPATMLSADVVIASISELDLVSLYKLVGT